VTPSEFLRLVGKPLTKGDFSFAVCGGIASSVYRTNFRTTNDIDFTLSFPEEKREISEKEFAINFLQSLGIKNYLGWSPGIATKDDSNLFLVVGELGIFLPNIDFILPNLPWVRQAVERAQNNLIDFGFGDIPTFTPEDLIISKAFSLSIEPARVQDQSDIDSILAGKAIRDFAYLEENLRKLGLEFKGAGLITAK
jgi:hypothetical protein